MAKPILVANWKNHPGSLTEARNLLHSINRGHGSYKKTILFIAPPLPYLDLISNSGSSFIHVASQDIATEAGGTYTGEVTPDILKSFGVKLSIIGHSERRKLGETDKAISQKVKNAIRSGITPLVCVGEHTRDQDGEHFEFLREQIESALDGLNRKTDVSKLAIAYEPVWAIGRHAEDAINSEDLSQSVLFIKKVLTNMFDRKVAESTPILYGGSVEADNAHVLFKDTGIRGFLVGHASLNAKSFKTIAESMNSK